MNEKAQFLLHELVQEISTTNREGVCFSCERVNDKKKGRKIHRVLKSGKEFAICNYCLGKMHQFIWSRNKTTVDDKLSHLWADKPLGIEEDLDIWPEHLFVEWLAVRLLRKAKCLAVN